MNLHPECAQNRCAGGSGTCDGETLNDNDEWVKCECACHQKEGQDGYEEGKPPN